jgi:hypothetical protein
LDSAVLSRKAVDTAEEWKFLDFCFKECFACTKGRAVVVGEDQIDVLQAAFVVLDNFITFLFCPVALKRRNNLNTRVFQGISKTFMPLLSR